MSSLPNEFRRNLHVVDDDPDPKPRKLVEPEEFPVHVLPEACQTLIREGVNASQYAPDLVALPMLAALSGAIGTSRVVEIKRGYREGATLFLAVVASPGAMKTPAASVGRGPVSERQRRLKREYQDEKRQYAKELAKWEVEKKQARNNDEPAPEKPEAPHMGRVLTSDTTVEALMPILEHNKRGVLVYRDELMSWVASMDQYKAGGKGADRQHWLSLWSNDEVVVDRKANDGEPIIVARPFISLFGGIQPDRLHELSGGMEDGLIDRFLFAYPAARYIPFSWAEISEDAERGYADLYNSLAEMYMAEDDYGDPNPKPLKLTDEARDAYEAMVNSMAAEIMQPGFPSRLEGVWSKMRGYLARLALVLAVCRFKEDPESYVCEQIEREDIERAGELISYFKTHVRRVFGQIAEEDPLDVLAGDLREYVAEWGGDIEETATKLHGDLKARNAGSVPERANELRQSVEKIGQRWSELNVSFGWRGKEKVIRLSLKSVVGVVGVVGEEDDTEASTNYANDTYDKKQGDTDYDGIEIVEEEEE